MKKLTLIALAAALLVAGTARAAAPIVSNVTAAQRAGTTLVDIRYDVADADGDALTVSVVLTSGATTLPAVTLTGAIGAGVTPGTGKLITWDAGADWPGRLASDVIAKVTADDGTSNMPTALYVVVDLSAGPSAASYPVTTLTAVPAGGWTDEYKTTKLVLRKINKGTFMMGSPATELGRLDDREDRHQVTLTRDFYIGVFEVTQKQWERVMGTTPSYYAGDMRPVDCAPYNMIRGSTLGTQWPANNSVDAASFMGRLRARTGLTFDLPTEAQWEYACRAGTTTALNSGKNLTATGTCPNMAEVGRYSYNLSDGKGGYTDAHTKVGSYLPNVWGLYDMHGNVYEWCLDWYVANLGTTAVTDPKGSSTGSNRLLRGGSFYYNARGCRSATRYYNIFSPGFNGSYYGLRAAVLPAAQ